MPKAISKAKPKTESKPETKAENELYVPICPKCGSLDVKSETNPTYAITGLMSVFKQCNACDHHGLVFPEVPASQVTKPTPPENVTDRQMVQTAYGKGYWKYLIYVLIPLALLIAIISFALR